METNKLLNGLTVVDLSRLLPGPFVSAQLAAMSARVIKIEDTGAGDYLRHIPPTKNGVGVRYQVLNRGKESVALNLKTEEGQKVIHKLLANADILLESFRPGVLAKLGLAPEELRQTYPELIVCSIVGYRPDGPWAKRAGHDINFLASSGILRATSNFHGPAVPGIQFGDLAGGGLWALSGLMAALYQREKSGTGAHVNIAMEQGLRALAQIDYAAAHAGEDNQNGMGLLSGGLACYRTYKTRDDRYLAVGALEPKFWLAFNKALGRESTPAEITGGDQEAIAAEIAVHIGAHPFSYWQEIFSQIDACVEPVLTFQESQKHATAAPNDFSPLGAIPEGSAPSQGEHTNAILAELGYSPEDIEQLRESSAIR